MTTTRIGSSDLEIFPLALGGNVFGWTADRDASFAVLDAFTEAGGTLIDTADSYSHWVPGHSGGESERTIGEWIAARKPQGVQLATKVGMQPGGPQLTASNVRAVAEQSLQRLGVETIDLFYAHKPDDVTPLEETVAAFDALVRDGLIRNIGLSNYSAEQVEQWLDIAEHTGAAKPVALQPQYSLVHRGDVEGPLLATAQRHELSILPYYSLASGFLTGKYREPVEAGSRRAPAAPRSTRRPRACESSTSSSASPASTARASPRPPSRGCASSPPWPRRSRARRSRRRSPASSPAPRSSSRMRSSRRSRKFRRRCCPRSDPADARLGPPGRVAHPAVANQIVRRPLALPERYLSMEKYMRSYHGSRRPCG